MVRSRSPVQIRPSAPYVHEALIGDDPVSSPMRLFTPARLAVLFFTCAYLLIGAFYLVHEHNNEFLIYLAVLTPLIVVAFYLQVRYDIPLWMLWLLSTLCALHLAGG